MNENIDDFYARAYVNTSSQWSRQSIDLATKLAALNQQSFAGFMDGLHEHRRENISRQEHSTRTSAIFAGVATASVVAGVAATSPVLVLAAGTAGLGLVGKLAYHWAKKNFANHDKDALTQMQKEIEARQPHESLSGKASNFISKMWNQVRKMFGDVQHAIASNVDKVDQKITDKMTRLVSPLAAMNQRKAMSSKAQPMSTAGLHAFRQTLARQLHGLAEAVEPAGPPQSFADMRAQAVEKFNTVGAGAIQKSKDIASSLATPVRQAGEALGARMTDAKAATQAGVNNRVDLVKSLLTRVSQAYQVLKGEMSVAPAQAAAAPTAQVASTLQNANAIAALTMAPAVEQAQVERAQIEHTKLLRLEFNDAV